MTQKTTANGNGTVGQPQADPGTAAVVAPRRSSVRLVGQTACADQVHGKYPAQHDRVVVEGPNV